MKYTAPPPNEPRFRVHTGGNPCDLEFEVQNGEWFSMMQLRHHSTQSAYCIAIIGWQREARKLAERGDMNDAQTAGANADAWLELIEELSR